LGGAIGQGEGSRAKKRFALLTGEERIKVRELYRGAE